MRSVSFVLHKGGFKTKRDNRCRAGGSGGAGGVRQQHPLFSSQSGQVHYRVHLEKINAEGTAPHLPLPGKEINGLTQQQRRNSAGASASFKGRESRGKGDTSVKAYFLALPTSNKTTIIYKK